MLYFQFLAEFLSFCNYLPFLHISNEYIIFHAKLDFIKCVLGHTYLLTPHYNQADTSGSNEISTH